MREQSPDERIKNFREVPYGYTEKEAIAEASRCIQCKNPPCVKGCPAEIDIPAFIAAIRDGDVRGAISTIKKTNNLPAVCGRVCPQEDQCEEKCVLMKKGAPINIGALERFASEVDESVTKKKEDRKPQKGQKVAVIGAGPAGLTCAADLARMGYTVTVFEGLHKPGGVLSYGIPEFRLPKDIVLKEVEYIKSLGVEIKLNYVIGRIKAIDDLRREGYVAFFISTGAGMPYFMGIPGENLNGVYSANEFLTRVNLMKAYRFPEYDTPISVGDKVAVIGAGNVAMDAARSAVRLGAARVEIIYRRSEEEMPARIEEIQRAREERVGFELLTTPIRMEGDGEGFVRKIVCLRNRLGDPDESGRRRPLSIEGSEFKEDVDTVIVAIGNGPNPLLANSVKGLELGRYGNIKADSDGRTNVKDIFAGGDIVTGADTVIGAMGAGKRAARAIDLFLPK